MSTETIVGTTYEWGFREFPGSDLWSEAVYDKATRSVVDAPFTEESARKAARNYHPSDAKLIRRSAGSVEVVEYEPPVLPAPTDEDLGAERAAGVMVGVLGEDIDWVVALGHVHPPDMAQAATLHLRDLCRDQPVESFAQADVEHVFAQRVEAWGYDFDWRLRWRCDGRPVPSVAPGAFPLTLVRTR